MKTKTKTKAKDRIMKSLEADAISLMDAATVKAIEANIKASGVKVSVEDVVRTFRNSKSNYGPDQLARYFSRCFERGALVGPKKIAKRFAGEAATGKAAKQASKAA